MSIVVFVRRIGRSDIHLTSSLPVSFQLALYCMDILQQYITVVIESKLQEIHSKATVK